MHPATPSKLSADSIGDLQKACAAVTCIKCNRLWHPNNQFSRQNVINNVSSRIQHSEKHINVLEDFINSEVDSPPSSEIDRNTQDDEASGLLDMLDSHFSADQKNGDHDH